MRMTKTALVRLRCGVAMAGLALLAQQAMADDLLEGTVDELAIEGEIAVDPIYVVDPLFEGDVDGQDPFILVALEDGVGEDGVIEDGVTDEDFVSVPRDGGVIDDETGEYVPGEEGEIPVMVTTGVLSDCGGCEVQTLSPEATQRGETVSLVGDMLQVDAPRTAVQGNLCDIPAFYVAWVCDDYLAGRNQ